MCVFYYLFYVCLVCFCLFSVNKKARLRLWLNLAGVDERMIKRGCRDWAKEGESTCSGSIIMIFVSFGHSYSPIEPRSTTGTRKKIYWKILIEALYLFIPFFSILVLVFPLRFLSPFILHWIAQRMRLWRKHRICFFFYILKWYL